jgi:hypothetical protein
MSEVALAAGFGSIRRFNETFLYLFRRSPSSLRRGSAGDVAVGASGEVTILLRYRPPYDWDAILAYLEARAVLGVEVVANRSYARWRLGQAFGPRRQRMVAIVYRRVGLAHDVTTSITHHIAELQAGRPSDSKKLAARAGRIESNADRIALEARNEVARLNAGPRSLESIDEPDQAAFIVSLAPGARHTWRLTEADATQ